MQYESYYTSAPVDIPEDFTAPTDSFKKKIILALLGLLAFIVLYFVLMFWFGKSAYRLLALVANGAAENQFFSIVAGICLAFLCIFMLKSLFDFSKKEEFGGRRITAEEEPVLFDFIHRLADEAGAPRPAKVYLTPQVNASVFYDLNLLNLFYPSKKNLNIGIGLVNVLSIGEFKAVLAHEFGHFAQNSMLLGRYVYMAQQIAARVVHKRDALDGFLSGLSRIDLRVAWIGWILSILVWAVRSLVESLFSVVALAERALSREMEFQADLVAASLTGSDALIHALHRLRAADDGFNAAIASMNERMSDNKIPVDLYALQSNHIDKMRLILDDARYGVTPEERGKEARVFDNIEINPPEMWSTHPADNDREENVKRIYLSAEIDERSSWELFKDPRATRQETTRSLLVDDIGELEFIENEEAVRAMNETDFEWMFLDRRYHGLFHNRFSFCAFDSLDEVFDQDSSAGKHSREECYPEEMKDRLEEFKMVLADKASLTVVKNEVRTAEKRKIVYRGDRIKRSEVDGILERLDSEEKRLRDVLRTHDMVCRTYHQLAARQIDHKLASYHKQLCHAVHYAEHTISDLLDVQGKFRNSVAIALADGRVSDSELNDILRVANEFHSRMNLCFRKSAEVEHSELFTERFKGKDYRGLFEDFTFPNATSENISDWSQAVDSWSGMMIGALMTLRNHCLEELLLAEEEIHHCLVTARPYGRQIGSIKLPEEYHRLMPGDERDIQMKLGLWDRFHQGHGIVPSVAKFSVAAAMVAGALVVGDISGSSSLHLFNGLTIPVNVEHAGGQYQLSPNEHEVVDVELSDGDTFIAKDLEGRLIDEAEVQIDIENASYLYNVAGAAMVYEYTVVYGRAFEAPNKQFGAPRFLKVDQNYILEEAPLQMETSSSGTSRTVLATLTGADVSTFSQYITDEQELAGLIDVHARWDKERSPYLTQFLMVSTQMDSSLSALHHRLAVDPWEVTSNRILMDLRTGADKEQLCAEYASAAEDDEQNAALYYLSARCADIDGTDAFSRGVEKWTDDPWLNYAAAYEDADKGRYAQAAEHYQKAMVDHEGIFSMAAPSAERCRRMAEAEGETVSSQCAIFGQHPSVAYYQAMENVSAELDDVDRAFALLANGDSGSGSTMIADKDDSARESYAWFLAASSGSSQEERDKILHASTTDLGFNALLIAIGLKARVGVPVEESIDDLRAIDPEMADGVGRFISSLRQNKVSEAEGQFTEIDNFLMKPYYALIGRIMLQQKTPEEWVKMVDHMLFAGEKPYFDPEEV